MRGDLGQEIQHLAQLRLQVHFAVQLVDGHEHGLTHGAWQCVCVYLRPVSLGDAASHEHEDENGG